jgi:hypothetical protein
MVASQGVLAAFQADCQMKLTFYVCKEVDYSKAPDVVVASCHGIRLYMVRWEQVTYIIGTNPFILSQVESQLGRHVRNLYPLDPAWLVRGSAFDMDAFLTHNF